MGAHSTAKTAAPWDNRVEDAPQRVRCNVLTHKRQDQAQEQERTPVVTQSARNLGCVDEEPEHHLGHPNTETKTGRFMASGRRDEAAPIDPTPPDRDRIPGTVEVSSFQGWNRDKG